MENRVEDDFSFSHGDSITQASVLRPYRGGCYISAFFIVKRRATGLSDFFVTGIGPLRSKKGIPEQLVKVIVADFRSSILEMPENAVWDDVQLPEGGPISEQLEALKAADLPLRYEVSETE